MASACLDGMEFVGDDCLIVACAGWAVNLSIAVACESGKAAEKALVLCDG
jgi:hypothetical protein